MNMARFLASSPSRLEDVGARDGSRRGRLGRVIDLARIYRACDLKTLARDLGRDPTRLIPDTGNPKLDLLAGLARNLDWTLPEVVRAIRGEIETTNVDDPSLHELPVRELDARCMNAHRRGRHQEMLSIACAMREKASHPVEHRLACTRLYGAYDAMGCYEQALDCAHDGLSRSGRDPEVRGFLLANLANAHYTLWNLVEARSVATEVIELTTPDTRRTRSIIAFARYVRGNALRRSLSRSRHGSRDIATNAHHDLALARGHYLELAEDGKDHAYQAIGATCLGGMLELEAALGTMTPEGAIDRMVIEDSDDMIGDALESRGWWAIFISNIALRHWTGQHLVDALAQSGARLEQIARRIDHWAFRAKAATIELERRDHARSESIALEPWRLDARSLASLTHTMGRLPAFRETGWRILMEHGALEHTMKTLSRNGKRGKTVLAGDGG